MIKKRKIISALLAVIMVFSVFSSLPLSTSAAEIKSENVGETYVSGDFEYELEEEYDWETEQLYIFARITEYNGSTTDVIIPSEIDGYKVVAIDYLYDYENCDKIKSFTIPESVSFISSYVFKYYDNLENIFVNDKNENYCDIDGVLFSLDNETNIPYELIIYPRTKSNNTYQIPEGVNRLASYAFYECSNLININVPKSINNFPVSDWSDSYIWERSSVENINVSSQNETYSSVDGVLFNKDKTQLILYPAGRKQTSYSIPETVNEICDGAFYTANNLENIDIPDNIVSIREKAFCYAENLNSIKFSNNINDIGDDAFYGTPWYDNQEDGVIYINNLLYEYKGWMPENTSITIKDGTKSICDNAFSYHNNLINIEFPDSVIYIGERAFVDCDSLINVKLSENITYLGSFAFESCDNLKSINIPEKLTGTGWDVFEDCINLESVYFNAIASSNNYEISFSFEFANSVKTIVYGNKVTEVSRDFSYNTGLETVVLGSNVKSIGSYAFSNCINLKSITIPESVTEIGESAFSGCTNLSELQMPSDIEKIGDGAFDDTAWYNNQPDGLLYIGKSFYDYKGDKTTLTDVKIDEGTKSILSGAFSECSNLKNVVIPDSVKSIGDAVFSGCTSLTNIIIPESVTSLGNSLFRECTSLKDAKLPSSLTEGDYYAWFEGCENLESVNIPNGVTDLQNTFYNCKKLKSIIIPESVTRIYRLTFHNCTSLESIVIPKNVVSVIDAFSDCTSLKSLVVDSDNKNLYSIDDALYSKEDKELIYYPEGKGDRNIKLPDGVEKIGNLALNNRISIESIDLPDTVTEIMYEAFQGCSSLAYVNIPESVKSIGTPFARGRSFLNCPNLKAVTIPSSVESIGSDSFGYINYYDDEKGYVKETVDNFTILGELGTAAETYANENGFIFIDLDNENYNHLDKNSNVKVIAKADAEIVVNEVLDKISLNKVSVLLQNNESVLNMYDISLMKNGNKVQHEGLAEVSIPCEEEAAKVYRVESDNTLTDMKAVYKDGYLKFYTEHFSEYVVTSQKDHVCGDINSDGVINAKDRMMLTRYLAKWSGYESVDITSADVNSDGDVNAKDRMILTRHLAKWSGYETLPYKK